MAEVFEPDARLVEQVRIGEYLIDLEQKTYGGSWQVVILKRGDQDRYLWNTYGPVLGFKVEDYGSDSQLARKRFDRLTAAIRSEVAA